MEAGGEKERSIRRRAARKTAELLMVVLILATGFYPLISDAWNQRVSDQMIVQYRTSLWEYAEDGDIRETLLAAELFNQELLKAGGGMHCEPTKEEHRLYENALNVDGSGMMGYLEIPKIQVYLPIYHGTEDAVLAKGVGHLEGSSLPVGGDGTHAVLTGHRGLPSATLFTDLDQLEKDDTFTISVLGEELTYAVTEIRTVLPEETENLRIADGKDQVTLVTCTPYGVNTHRLLVTGTRKKELQQAQTMLSGETAGTTQNAANASNEWEPDSSINRRWYRRPALILGCTAAAAVAGICRFLWIWTIDLTRARRKKSPSRNGPRSIRRSRTANSRPWAGEERYE